jgi:hypothetical protein
MYVKGFGQTHRFSEAARSEAVVQTAIRGHSHIDSQLRYLDLNCRVLERKVELHLELSLSRKRSFKHRIATL